MNTEGCNISVMKNRAAVGLMEHRFFPGGPLSLGKERKGATRANSDEVAKVRSGMIIVRIRDGIVGIPYANDPGKLAARIIASDVEKASKKKETTP